MIEGEMQNVPVDDIEIFASQSRETFDESELNSLADDLKARGQLQAGVAWFDEGRGRFILICGERRLRALKLASLPTMLVKVIRGKFTQGELLAMNIAENLQRASLNAIERGKAFRRMMQLEGITAREVASRLHVSDATVSRDLALLDLGPELQAQVINGGLPSSVAATLARLGDEETRRFLADRFASGELGRDGITTEVNRRLGRKRTGAKPARLPVKLESLTITVSAARPLTRKELLDLCERLKQEASKLPKEGTESEAARLRAS